MRAAADLSGSAPLPPIAKVALAGEVISAYVAARRSMRRAGLRGALADLRSVKPTRTAGDPVADGRRLGRIVARTLRALPADGRCLSQSLVLTRLLARRGIESRLVIAVRPGERLAAHAWVEYDGVPLLPPDRDRLEELVTL